MTENLDPAGLAEIYFDAWQAGDSARLRRILAADVTFAGPMGTATGVDACVKGLAGMATMFNDIVIHERLADATDVMTWYDLVTDSGALPTVNWSHVEDGLITAIRATFDPRPLLGG
jgi:ketosteroid isomerase-like protein